MKFYYKIFPNIDLFCLLKINEKKMPIASIFDSFDRIPIFGMKLYANNVVLCSVFFSLQAFEWNRFTYKK